MDRTQVADLMRSLDDESRRVGLYMQQVNVQVQADGGIPLDENGEPVLDELDPRKIQISTSFLVGDYAWRAGDEDAPPDPAASILPDDLAEDLERNALRAELDLDLGDE